MNYKAEILIPDPPVSMGLLLSYKCNTACKYCIYASSPSWRGDWIGLDNAEIIFTHLSKIFNSIYPANQKFTKTNSLPISFSYGIHFTGGEPFLNYKLLLKLTELAAKYNIPSPFVETNCFWAKDDVTATQKLTQLKKAGLAGILISVNPFTVEFIPFERIDRAVRTGSKIFGSNFIVYQNFYLNLFRSMNLKEKIPFEDFLKVVDLKNFYNYIELLPMGRAPYKLGTLFKKYPPENFLYQDCYSEMTRDWHTHIDNYCNYIPGFCAGISLGDFRQYNSIFIDGINLDKRPVLKALTKNLGKLLEIGREFGFKECSEGYISKCHLCTEIRKHIVSKTEEFKELAPLQFYKNLN